MLSQKVHVKKRRDYIKSVILNNFTNSVLGSDLPVQKFQNLKDVLESQFCQNVKDVSSIINVIVQGGGASTEMQIFMF